MCNYFADIVNCLSHTAYTSFPPLCNQCPIYAPYRLYLTPLHVPTIMKAARRRPAAAGAQQLFFFCHKL